MVFAEIHQTSKTKNRSALLATSAQSSGSSHQTAVCSISILEDAGKAPFVILVGVRQNEEFPMQRFVFSPFKSVQRFNQYLLQTPDRALEQAYDAALKITALEGESFNGDRIDLKATCYSDSALTYLHTEVQKYLKIIQLRLWEFNLSQPIVSFARSAVPWNAATPASPVLTPNVQWVEKLKFIGQVVGRYQPDLAQPDAPAPINPTDRSETNSSQKVDELTNSQPDLIEKIETISDQTGLLPRSILSSFNRLQKQLEPEAETTAVRSFRQARRRTMISIRLILLLIILPLLTQQLSKPLLVGPIVDRWHGDSGEVFLNRDLETAALSELRIFEAGLRFQDRVGITPQLPVETIEAKIQAKAQELARSFHTESTNAIKNVFSDLLALAVFVVMVFCKRSEILILKSFLNEAAYDLSDSAKAFLIILFTNIFVGFHSPHGWEMLLGAISRHLGLPESREFIFLFIATFPVILNSVFLYWIFRYLNNISPSAVATYREMND